MNSQQCQWKITILFSHFLLEFRSRLLLPACELVLFSIGSNCSLRLHYRANFLTKKATMGSNALFRHIWILILLVNASSKDLWTQCESPSCSRAKEKWHDIDHVLAQLSRLTDVGKKHTGPSTEFFKIVEFHYIYRFDKETVIFYRINCLFLQYR